jgi:hypothetical protein
MRLGKTLGGDYKNISFDICAENPEDQKILNEIREQTIKKKRVYYAAFCLGLDGSSINLTLTQKLL